MGKTDKEEKRRMKKERREEKKKQKQKQRKTFVQEYEEISQSLHKVKFILIFVVITMLAFTSVMYKRSVMKNGDAPYNYSEEPYEKIKEVLEGTTGDSTEKVDDEEFIACLTEEAGLDIKSFREYVTDYEVRSEGENTILTAWIKNGSFIAKVIITIDKDYHVIDTKRNFDNANEHKDRFYDSLYVDSIIFGAILAGVVNILIWKVLKFTVWIVKKCTDKRKLKNSIEKNMSEESTNKEEIDTM
ncbi:MAG: hypothetical protein HFJ49_01540 [Clostridia bacterium]|nr:hypothetical protein [Clostridia bacterium]